METIRGFCFSEKNRNLECFSFGGHGVQSFSFGLQLKKIKGENAALRYTTAVMFELDYDNGFAHKVQSLVECQSLIQDEQY
jgi:hypothetical protein